MLKALAFTCFLLLAGSPDFTGHWTGTIDVRDDGSGTDITTAVKLDLVQSGEAISGTVGRPEDAQLTPIKNVKVEGNKLTFEASSGETSEPVKFALAVEGDRMEGVMKTVLDAQVLTGKVKIVRAKT